MVGNKQKNDEKNCERIYVKHYYSPDLLYEKKINIMSF